MRVCVVGAGTRGDAQPAVALARSLQQRGHEVVLGVSPDQLGLAARAGLRALPFGPDTQAELTSPEGQRMLAAGDGRRFLARLSAVASARYEDNVRELTALTRGADLLVTGMLAEDAGLCFAEALGVPLVALHLAPLRPTRACAAPFVTTRQLPGALNRLTGQLFVQAWHRTLAADLGRLRRHLGLPPARSTTAARLAARGATELQAYSEVVVPGLMDLGPRRPRVGHLVPDRVLLGDPPLDADLEAWLAGGAPPVLLGFGSMPVLDPPAVLARVRRVTALLGVRALVSGGPGWGATGGDTGSYVTGPLDHDAVLPRCRAVVHHGGAGTTAAVLRAGRPALVAPVFADQPFWGARVTRLGAGASVRLVDLDERRLEAGLQAALRPEVARRAEALGVRLRAEDGAAERAADLVEAAAG